MTVVGNQTADTNGLSMAGNYVFSFTTLPIPVAVNDPPGASNACDVDPKGHPSAAMHEAWATQIFSWLVANNLLP